MHNTRHTTVIIHYLPCLLILFTWHIHLEPRDIDQLVCIILDHRRIILRSHGSRVVIAIIRTLYEDDIRMHLLDIIGLIILHIEIVRILIALIIRFLYRTLRIPQIIRNWKHRHFRPCFLFFSPPYTVKRLPVGCFVCQEQHTLLRYTSLHTFFEPICDFCQYTCQIIHINSNTLFHGLTCQFVYLI